MRGKGLRILLSAYACEPGKGSEPGVGWHWAVHLSRYHEIWVITRRNNREIIESTLAQTPVPNLHFVYFDLPWWLRIWKRQNRCVHWYYYLWQIGAYFVARRLQRKVAFDVVHHLTFGNYWMPSFMALLPTPFVWGPVGGGESTPRALRSTLNLRARTYELVRDIVQWLGEKDPFVRADAKRALIALSKTVETAERIRLMGANQIELYSEAALPERELEQLYKLPFRDSAPFRLVSIGRLRAFKGFHLGLEAFARFQQVVPGSEYYVIGDGAERRALERLISRLGIADKVHFLGQLPRTQVLDMLEQCDALVHPSMHESGGWVCLEAMAAGRPVICLDLGGPAVQVTQATGFKISAFDSAQVVGDLSAAMVKLALDHDLRAAMSNACRKRVQEYFTWEKKAAVLARFYECLAYENEPARAAAYSLAAAESAPAQRG